ncbi:putative transmembrane protein [Sesbania bispinosa]|nr:putative transmembrane protein [Sesbania bispinosa]
MKMKKVAYVILFVAASVSVVMAHSDHHHARSVPSPSPAPGPSNDTASLGCFLGFYLISFIAYYLQF